jgi:hypothetical protein
VGDHLYSWFFKGFDYADPTNCIGTTAVPYYAKLKTDLRALYGRDVPVFVGEYSCRIGEEASKLTPAEIYDDNLCNSELVIRLMNVGVGGFLQWWFADNTIPPWDNREPQLNALTRDAHKRLVPQASVFYPHAILARYIERGWDILDQDMTGGKDDKQIQRVFAAALRDPATHHVTVLAVNDSYTFCSLRLSFGSMPITGTLHQIYVTGPVPDGLHQDADVTLTANNGNVTLRARSVVALTTMEAGDLTLPR